MDEFQNALKANAQLRGATETFVENFRQRPPPPELHECVVTQFLKSLTLAQQAWDPAQNAPALTTTNSSGSNSVVTARKSPSGKLNPSLLRSGKIYLLHHLYDVIVFDPQRAESDKRVGIVCMSLCHVLQPHHLDIHRFAERLADRISQITSFLKSIPQNPTSRGKVQCVVRACKLMSEVIGEGKGADDFMNVLVYALILSCIPHIVQEIDFCMRWEFDQSWGQEAYYLTSISGALAFIENIDGSSLSLATDEINQFGGLCLSAPTAPEYPLSRHSSQQQQHQQRRSINSDSESDGESTTRSSSTTTTTTTTKLSSDVTAKQSSTNSENNGMAWWRMWSSESSLSSTNNEATFVDHALLQDPVLVGWLYKRGQMNKAWRRRWCELRGHVLFYHKNQKAPPKGYVVLTNAYVRDCSRAYNNSTTHQFDVCMPRRVFKFKTHSGRALQTWVSHLSSVSRLGSIASHFIDPTSNYNSNNKSNTKLVPSGSNNFGLASLWANILSFLGTCLWCWFGGGVQRQFFSLKEERQSVGGHTIAETDVDDSPIIEMTGNMLSPPTDLESGMCAESPQRKESMSKKIFRQAFQCVLVVVLTSALLLGAYFFSQHVFYTKDFHNHVGPFPDSQPTKSLKFTQY